MSAWLQDLRDALRTLRRRPLRSLVVALVLALGIGVNATVFSVVDSVLLRSLPVTEPGRLVKLVLTRLDRGGRYGVHYRHYQAWRRSAHAFDDLTALRYRVFVRSDSDQAVRLQGTEVSAEYFRTLGVRPRLGRAFAPDDFTGGHNVVLISDALWQRSFGGDPDVIGRRLVLDREPRTVVGVMPPGSELPSLGWQDLWTPLAVDELAAQDRPGWGFSVIGRLRDGTDLAAAQRDVDAIAARLAAEDPAADQGWGVELLPIEGWIFGDVRTPLWVVYGVAVLLLLIACGTVSNLVYVAAAARRRDVAVRKALGARPARLFRQLLLENVTLAVGAGCVGFAAARAGVGLLPALVPEIPRIAEVQVDLRVLGVTLATAVAAGVVSALAPALTLTRTPTGILRSSGERTGGGRGVHRTRRILVAAETALAMVAVLAAGLLVKSLAELTAVDPGFEPRGLLTLRVDLPEDRFSEPEARRAAIAELLDRIAALPGVEATGASGIGLPLAGSHGVFEIFVEGRPRPPRPDVLVEAQTVTPGYREALGIDLVEGRWFADGETWESAHAVVVNETFARRYWPGEEPIGRWVEWSSGDRGWVVGVVADVRQLALHLESSAELYLAWGKVPSSQALAVRTSALDPGSLTAPIRRAVSRLLPGAPVYAVATGDDLVRESYAERRLWTILIGAFAVLSLGLGWLGFYGVVAHAVASRGREIGIRMALGALPRAILAMVVGQSLRPVAAGVAAGGLLALGLTRFLESQLYAVSAHDPSTFGLGVAAVVASAVAVSALPARRAARVDPAVAVRDVE